MKPVAALVAITLILLAGPLTGAALAAPPPAAPAQPPVDAGPLRLELAELTPRVVTATGPSTLTVAGTLTNTGDRPVGELVIRVQRGDPLTGEGQVRDALDGEAGTDGVTPQFTPIPGELAPGAQVPVRLSVALRGAPETSLALSSAGVYELLVNVNGVPRDAPRARLAAVRALLPVLSLPAGPDTGPAVAKQAPGAPTPFSLLYPVADTPRRLPTVPGEPTLLTDDDLAASLAPEGRLGGLVTALAEAAPVGSRLRDATCLALDPDLVGTVAAMRSGYQVRRPDGTSVPGAGTEVAARWLDTLVAVARDGCVIALPYADADLVALTRGGLGELATSAVADGRQVLAETLQTPVVPDVAWPVDGVTDEPTLDRIAQAGGRSVILSAEGVEQGRFQRGSGVLPIAGGRVPQFTVLTDPLLSTAAAGPSATATVPDGGRGSAAAADTPAGTGSPLSTQDAIGALAFRALTGPAAAGRSGTGPLVLAPPHQWAAGSEGARALLDAADVLLGAGRLAPRALGAVLATGPPADAGAQPVVYPLAAGGREIPPAAVDTVRTTAADVTDLRSAAVPGTGVGVGPDEAFAPLLRGLVRPVSAAWRGRPAQSVGAADAAAGRIAELRASVRVLEPPSPYSLGTSDAPILITVSNGLPFTVQVRVEIAPSSGLRVAPIEPQRVPPLGRRQVRVSAEVIRSGQFTVQALVRTPEGELLGPASRLRVRSTAYGTITVWLTGSAGVLLVVLAVRRVLRRVRGEPARRGRGRPVPGPHTPGPAPATPDPTRHTPGPVPAKPDPTRPAPPAPPARDRRPPVPRKTGDPFPDPLAPTDRLPVARPRPNGETLPPGPPPPRIPST